MHRCTMAAFLVVVMFGLTLGCRPQPEPTKPPPVSPDTPPVGPATPLLELLGKLPKERWPKNPSDSLGWEKADAWYKDYVKGQRASLSDLKAADFKFESEGGGKYRAGITVVERMEELYEIKPIYLNIYGIKVSGLSEKAAEQLRAWSNEKPLEMTFTITEAYRSTGVSGLINVKVKDVAIKGIE